MRSAATRIPPPRVWPIMRGSAQFCLDWLVIDPRTGKLVSGPVNSPENSFVAPDGSRCSISMGPSMDQEIAWELFTNVLDAAAALGVEDELVKHVSEARGFNRHAEDRRPMAG